MKVYLAGPIAGQDDTATFWWRDMVTGLLRLDDIETIDPAKRRDFRNVPYPGDLFVVEPDKADINDCEVLLANAHVISVGTSMEILYAWERGKLVAVRHPEPEHASPWLHYHSHVFADNLGSLLDEIVAYSKLSFVDRTARLKNRTDC